MSIAERIQEEYVAMILYRKRVQCWGVTGPNCGNGWILHKINSTGQTVAVLSTLHGMLVAMEPMSMQAHALELEAHVRNLDAARRGEWATGMMATHREPTARIRA